MNLQKQQEEKVIFLRKAYEAAYEHLPSSPLSVRIKPIELGKSIGYDDVTTKRVMMELVSEKYLESTLGTGSLSITQRGLNYLRENERAASPLNDKSSTKTTPDLPCFVLSEKERLQALEQGAKYFYYEPYCYFKITEKFDNASMQGYLRHKDLNGGYHTFINHVYTYFQSYQKGEPIYLTFDKIAYYCVTNIITTNPLTFCLDKISNSSSHQNAVVNDQIKKESAQNNINMVTIENNKTINKFRELLTSAIKLKEGFDKKMSKEMLTALYTTYDKDFDALLEICPKEIFKESNLGRHSSFIEKYIREEAPDKCYHDIEDICYRDIFLVEEKYLNYLMSAEVAQDRYYDWKMIHPVIIKIAQKRFASSHFADAVEASFKEINDLVKKKYKAIKKVELDGDKLMREAFTTSKNNNYTPVINLADNTDENGRNIQQGYMNLFAGAMQGIRNPKAHTNLDVNPNEAWEMIVLASHLMRMFEKFNKL